MMDWGFWWAETRRECGYGGDIPESICAKINDTGNTGLHAVVSLQPQRKDYHN
jgi:hypothetical protein